MHRSQFIQQLLLLPAAMSIRCGQHSSSIAKNTIMTVKGPIDADKLGPALIHEHMLVDFIGADKVNPARYNQQEVFDTMLPLVQAAKAAGCAAVFECTPAYLGRDVKLLQRLSAAAGVHFITNTGYYAAANNKFLPPHAFTETAAQLAGKWIGEWERGIDGTGIKPGFMKISVDKAPLQPVYQKIVQAAAITHRSTGLTIASHTGDGAAAVEQLAILQKEGISPEAFIWVHAQNEKDFNYHKQVGEKGAWISLDGLGWAPVADYVKMLLQIKSFGLLHRGLVSHDAGWYHVGEANGGDIQPFTKFFTDLVPALRSAGFIEQELRAIHTTNPVKAFVIGKRLSAT